MKKFDPITREILNDLEKLHQGKILGGETGLQKYWKFIFSVDPDFVNPFEGKKLRATGNGVDR